MDLTLRTDYWQDRAARKAFMDFIYEIHGLDFSRWDSGGYWDPAYTAFSFFQGQRVVASVCIYRMDTILNGKPAPMTQISGVGTLPEWRHKGLNRTLTEMGLEWAGNAPVATFLFSDEEAVPYYLKSGFEPLDEYIETMSICGREPIRGAHKLELERPSDLQKIKGYVDESAPISNRFCLINPRLTMFHLLYFLSDVIYEIPELECLVCYRREEAVLRIFTVLGTRIPVFQNLYPYIALPSDRKVEFHFYADKLGVVGTELEPLAENMPMCKGPFPLEQPVFPYTMRA